MKQTVNSNDFVDAFRSHNRQDQFSYAGLHALFEYLEELERDLGEEYELDVIALCCEYSEYSSAVEAADEHGFEFDAEDSEEHRNEKAMDWLRDNTTVIEHDKGIIIQSF